ncbi:MAG: MFS transporter [Acidimicrobiales bacterium]|nr:MFS transporter [Acidimicrobiales bacterium]MCB9393924.1 MFS transporter [Acidimicrobiaceae bacterium]
MSVPVATTTKAARRDGRVGLVVAVLSIAFVGFGATLALLPERVRELGHGDLAVGAAAGVFPAAAIAGRLLSGRMIDRSGARLTLTWGIALTAVGSAALGLPHLAGLLVARAVQGFGDGLLYTAAAAAALELVPVARRGQALGWLSAGLWTGLSLGAAAGPWFSGLPAAGVSVAVVTAIGLALVPLLPRSAPSGAGDGRWLERRAARPALVVGLTNSGYAAITGFAVLLADGRFGHGNWLLTTFGVSLLVVRGGLGFVADRVPPRAGLTGAFGVLGFGLLTVSLSPSLPVAIVGIVICALGHSLPWPILVTTTIDELGDERRGAVIGTMTAGFDITVAVLLVAFGGVSALAGPTAVFVTAIVLVGAAHMVSLPLALRRATA